MGAFSTFVLSLSLIAEPGGRQALEKAVVKSVIATDVVVVEVPENPRLWVTLLGVGKPENADSRKDRFLSGQADLNWLQTWLPPGTPVLMERRGVSYLGRPLVILYRVEDKLCWNAYLIKTGGAFAQEQTPFPEFRKYLAMERDAKEQGNGLWAGHPKSDAASVSTSVIALSTGTAVSDARPNATSSPSSPANTRKVQTVFSPENFSPPKRKKRRYASQEQARAEVDQMMGMMLQGIASGGFGGNYGGGYGKTVRVRGYFNSNGTYVDSYWRRPPSR